MYKHEPTALGLTPAQTRAVITTAALAPSLHNTQPWRFRPAPEAITVIADRSRRLPRTDPDDRELRIACGAALFTLRLALHGYGIRPRVTVLPPGADRDVIAVVQHGGRQPATPELAELLAAVPRRHTNRRPFGDTAVTLPDQHLLRRAAQAENAWLHLVEDRSQRTRLHDLARSAHRSQMADPDFRAELERWTGVAPTSTTGVPATAGGPLPSPALGWVHRDFTGGTTGDPDTDHRFEDDPLIAVLGSHLPGAAGDVQAGQALQRVLLTATVHGLAASFLSQVVEVEATRAQLHQLIRSNRPPQLVLRIGHGYPVGATPRRSVADLLDPPPVPAP